MADAGVEGVTGRVVLQSGEDILAVRTQIVVCTCSAHLFFSRMAVL